MADVGTKIKVVMLGIEKLSTEITKHAQKMLGKFQEQLEMFYKHRKDLGVKAKAEAKKSSTPSKKSR